MEHMSIDEIAIELTGDPIQYKDAVHYRQSLVTNRTLACKLADRLDLLVHLAAINGQRAAAASIAERTLQHLAAQAGKDAEFYAAIQSGDITGLYESLGVNIGADAEESE